MLIFQKRFFLILVGVVFCTLALSVSVSAQPQPIFPDIQGHWGEQPIKTLAERNVLNGYPDGSLNQISRLPALNSPKC